MLQMKNTFNCPNWIPEVPSGMRVLITGSTGGLGKALVAMLLDGPDCTIGAHGRRQIYKNDDKRIIPLTYDFENSDDCQTLVDKFVKKAGGIDALVVLSGSIRATSHWRDISGSEWEGELSVNLTQPFFLAKAAMAYMKNQKTGGRIILNGTESALHGGSITSLPYAIAKRGTECMVQGLAREGAPSNILVNGVRLGYIASGFHQRWHKKTKQDMAKRANMVPLKRGGDPDEAAALMIYLLSGWANFITGQMLPLTRG